MTTDVTTIFSDDTSGDLVKPSVPTDVDSNLITSTQSVGAQTIIDFLQKPILLNSGFLTSSDSGPIFVVHTLSGILSNTLYAKKLEGVGYIRADLVFELKVNATRFQQGRYMLTCVNAGGMNFNSTVITNRMRFVNLMTKTQLPHVEIDLATETSCTLEVPYVSMFGYFPVKSAKILSTVSLFPYAALQPGSGDSVCSYDIYVHMKNISLSGCVVAQSGRSISFKEQKAAKTGPVSVFMGKVSRTSEILGRIPMLMPVANSVAWAADVLGDAAHVWGWSKPTTVNPAQLYARQSNTQMTLTDGTFVGHKLSASSLQGVTSTNGVARTAIDELSIDFIKSQYAYFSRIVWNPTDLAGTQIATFPITPTFYNTNYGVGKTYAPVAFLANFFSLYRGGLKFRFKFVKTEFHSGRLAFAFLPVEPTTTLTPPILTFAQTDNLYREIVDIRTTNEIEVTVPFIADRNYVGTDACYGHLYVFVVNQLIAPDVVNSDISLLTEVCGADDLTFEEPLAFQKKQVYVPFQSDKLAIVFPKMGASNDHILYNKVSIGEKFNSIRQLIKRFQTFGGLPGSSTSIYSIAPFAFSWCYQATSLATPLTRNNAGYDFLSLMAGCYTFSHGGVRFIFMPDNFTNAGMRIEIAPRVDNSTVVYEDPLFSVLGDGQNPLQYVMPNVEGNFNVEVPYYSGMISRATMAAAIIPAAFIATPVLREEGAPGVSLRWGDNAVNKPVHLVARAASEDFTFSGWLGVPPLVISTTT